MKKVEVSLEVGVVDEILWKSLIQTLQGQLTDSEDVVILFFHGLVGGTRWMGKGKEEGARRKEGRERERGRKEGRISSREGRTKEEERREGGRKVKRRKET